jgi:hypothetical protein
MEAKNAPNEKRIMLSKRLKHVWHGKDIQCNAINSPTKLASERANRNTK